MFSLSTAVPLLPAYVVGHVQEYLEIKDYVGWRVTSKQAFQDVEELTKEQWKRLPDHESRFLSKFEMHSWFLDYLSQSYTCNDCGKRQAANPEWEELHLCMTCFAKHPGVNVCQGNECNTLCFAGTDECHECAGCSFVLCEDCFPDGGMQWCDLCNELFCFQCLIDHREDEH
jgi:hypothetical protein